MSKTLSTCAAQNSDTRNDWRAAFEKSLPVLGHRNWIVITDMAYPLQTAAGVETIYSGEPVDSVLPFVVKAVGSQPHVYAHVYLDREQLPLTDKLCKGIEAFRSLTKSCFSADEAQYRPHEELIKQLDEASRLYKVVLIKTTTLLPYTTVFLQLDCKYWNAEQQKALDALSK